MSDTQKLLDYLKTQIGKPYEYGAEGPGSFDCSGLTQTAFKEACQIDLPRISKDQGINRAEVLKIILEAFKIPLIESGDLPFPDVKPEDWFYYYVVYAIAHNLIDPATETKFGSGNEMKRGEMCKVVDLLLT